MAQARAVPKDVSVYDAKAKRIADIPQEHARLLESKTGEQLSDPLAGSGFVAEGFQIVI
jgi:hypothetical protein